MIIRFQCFVFVITPSNVHEYRDKEVSFIISLLMSQYSIHFFLITCNYFIFLRIFLIVNTALSNSINFETNVLETSEAP